MERLALLDLRALGVEHPDRAEGDLDGLAEPHDDLARRALGRAALGRRALEQRVRLRGRSGGQRDGERRQEDEEPPHQASRRARPRRAAAAG